LNKQVVKLQIYVYKICDSPKLCWYVANYHPT